jgi:hypothetical protein
VKSSGDHQCGVGVGRSTPNDGDRDSLLYIGHEFHIDTADLFYCEKLTKHMNALCRRSADVKAGGSYANNHDLNS